MVLSDSRNPKEGLRLGISEAATLKEAEGNWFMSSTNMVPGGIYKDKLPRLIFFVLGLGCG